MLTIYQADETEVAVNEADTITAIYTVDWASDPRIDLTLIAYCAEPSIVGPSTSILMIV